MSKTDQISPWQAGARPVMTMTHDQSIPYTRLRALPAFLGLFLLGVLLLCISLPMLIPPTHAVMNHAPFVSFWPRDVIVVPIAFVFFSLALITMIRPSAIGLDQGRGKRRKLSRRWTIVLNVCLGMAMANALLTVAAVPLHAEAALPVLPAAAAIRAAPAAAVGAVL